jgi:hypothetical protein
MDKLTLEKLELLINSNEYFNHYTTILMSKAKKSQTNIYYNIENDIVEDIENTFKRKELANYYRDNKMLPLAYIPIANSDNLKNELRKIKKKLRRKIIINNLLN